MIDWLAKTGQALVELTGSPEQTAELALVLNTLQNSWIANKYPEVYLGLLTKLQENLGEKIDELLAAIAEAAPALKPFMISPNQFAIYQKAKRDFSSIPDAIDTIKYLEENKTALDRVNKVLADAISGREDRFRLVQAEKVPADDTLNKLLNDKEFFQRTGGAILLLAVRKKDGKEYLYLRITGRRVSGEWRFEAELPK